MKRRLHWVKISFSIVLVFHLIGVLLTPNPNSYAFRGLSSVYRPYMDFLGLGSTWGFFAPEPVSPPLYIDYVLEQKNALSIMGRFPPEQNPYFFRDRYNRLMTLSKFILASDENIKAMFIAHLCREYPNTQSAKLWRVTGMQPSLDLVQRGEKKMTDAIDYRIEVLDTYYCPEKL